VAGFSYSFGGSCLILFIINFIPGLHLRASEQDEIMGMDDAEIGEFAYDYVEVSRDVVHGIEEDPDNEDTPDGSASGLREKRLRG
jgi:ammonium transporter, Amt family